MVARDGLVKSLIDDNFLFALSDHDEGSFFVLVFLCFEISPEM